MQEKKPKTLFCPYSIGILLFTPYAQKQWKIFKLSNRPALLDWCVMATCNAARALSQSLGGCAGISYARAHPQACLRAHLVLAIDLDRTVTDA